MNRRRALDEFAERAQSEPFRAALDEAAAQALDALDAAGVDALLLKGPALARILYSEGETRGYSDIDLLVGPGDLARAAPGLESIGYRRIGAGIIDDVAGVLHAETWVRRAPTAELGHHLIDLHWRIYGCDAPAELVWEVLAPRRASIDLGPRPAPTLDRAGLALHMATHAAQHGPDSLKPIADLARGIERWPEDVWRDAAKLAAQLEGTPAFAAGLRLLPAGAELAGDLGLPPTDELTWAILNREARPRGAFQLDALSRARGFRKRANILRRSLFPNREWVIAHHPWAGAGRIPLAGAYAMHLTRAPVWAARAWRYRRRERRAGG